MDGLVFRKVADFERVAAGKTDPDIYAYIESAAGENSLSENCQAFRRWRFRPRLLRNVKVIDTTTDVLGSKLSFPVCIATTAFHEDLAVEGEVATAKAAEALGTGMTLNLLSSRKMEDVAREAPNLLRWCHLQVTQDRQFLSKYMKRAEKNGFSAFIVTIDQPVVSRRVVKTAIGNPIGYVPRNRVKNLEEYATSDVKGVFDWFTETNLDPLNSWDDIDWIKASTPLPVAVKGILTEEMALEAVNHGVDAIIVSNHGGRQLDSTFATIDSLPEVVRAVKGKCDVYFDGGVRSGEDVAKAISLGAKAVFVGRPVLWGLAVDGRKGVQKVLEMLRDEFEIAMRLLGVTSIKELQNSKNLVVHENYLFSKL